MPKIDQLIYSEPAQDANQRYDSGDVREICFKGMLPIHIKMLTLTRFETFIPKEVEEVHAKKTPNQNNNQQQTQDKQLSLIECSL